MARQAREAITEEPPAVDPEVVRDAYRLHRARRRSRVEHKRRMRRAGVRFWFVLILLVAASVALSVVLWHEIQQLFGL
jgi:hypothetical protein